MSENEKNLEKAPTWQERIARTGYNPEADKMTEDTILYQLASLHDDRFYFWKCFINSFFDKKNDKKNDWKKTVCSRKMPYKKFEKMVVDRGNVWSKITLLNRKGEEQYIFDAGFGSLDVESDLDVSIYGIDVEIIQEWIVFLKQNRPQNSTFSAYYDSNFYFEPSIRDSDGKLVSRAKNEVRKFLITRETEGETNTEHSLIPNKTNIVEAMGIIVKYAKAYIDGKPLILKKHVKDGKLHDGSFLTVYPNPQSNDFRLEEEIEQYAAMEYFGHECKDPRSTMKDFMIFGCTKSEALLSAMSVAICAVFGDHMKSEIIDGIDGINDKKIRGDDTSWRLITALEMLYNLKMHQDNHGHIKTKYIRRLEDTLVASKFRCRKENTDKFRRSAIKIDLKKSLLSILEKKKRKLTDDIRKFISVSVTDEVNGVVCSNEEVRKTTIDENIQEIEERIKSWAAGTADSPAGDGESSEDDADSGTLPLYHQFVNPIDQ